EKSQSPFAMDTTRYNSEKLSRQFSTTVLTPTADFSAKARKRETPSMDRCKERSMSPCTARRCGDQAVPDLLKAVYDVLRSLLGLCRSADRRVRRQSSRQARRRRRTFFPRFADLLASPQSWSHRG